MDVRQGGERGLACVLIDDKDDLRRCIRACVRGLSLVDVATRLDVARPQMGVDAAMRSIAPGEPPDEAFVRLMIESTPLSKAAQDVVTALDRLNMPQGDLQVIRMREASLTPSAYLEMVRAQAGLAAALSPVVPDAYGGERAADFLVPALDLSSCRGETGRYAEGYGETAQRLTAYVKEQGIRDAALGEVDAQALLDGWMRYAFCPLCEDAGLVLTLGLSDEAALSALRSMMRDFPRLRAAVWCAHAGDEAALLTAAAARRDRLLPCIRPESIPLALEDDRPRFLLRPSLAAAADRTIGYWRRMRAQTARTLYECYLPLLRSGFALTDQGIEQDILRMMQTGFDALHEDILEDI